MFDGLYLILFCVLFALTSIAAVGHGLWLLGAMILRAIFRPPASRTPRAPGAPRPQREPDPPPKEDGRPTVGSDLEATRRQLLRFRNRGLIEAETHKELLGLVIRELGTEARKASGEDVQPEPSPVQEPVPTPEPVLVSSQSVETTPRPEPTPAVAPLPESSAEPPPEPEPPTAPMRAPPRQPRRAFAEILSSFLHEKHIQWGELVAGMLIVFCSTALVISLWDTISTRPTLKFLTFLGVNTALFGAGIFMHRRWKLPTTSSSVLVIATLLVPLNFLAISAFGRQGVLSGPWMIALEIVALVAFAALVGRSGRVTTVPWPPLLAIAVIGPSAAQLLIGHSVGPETSPAALAGFATLPLLAYAGAVGWAIRLALRWQGFGRRKAGAFFALLGLGGFAALLATGLLIHKSGHAAAALDDLSLVICAYGMTLISAGTLLWHRLRHKRLVPQRTAGTAVLVAGALLMLYSLVLAWPTPSALVPVALLSFGVLSAVAVRARIAVAHLVALTCLTAAALVTFHALAGRIPWGNENPVELLGQLLSARSGAPLCALSFITGSVAALLGLRGRTRDRAAYAIATLGIAALSVSVATLFGFGRVIDHGTAWIYGIYTVAALAAAAVSRRSFVTWIGSALALLAIAQIVAFRFQDSFLFAFPWQIVFLTHAGFATVCAMAALAVTGVRRGAMKAGLATPLAWSAIITSGVAALLILSSVPFAETGALSLRTCWLAGVWFACAVLLARPALLTAGQVALASTLLLAVTSWLEGQEWFRSAHSLLDPRALQAYGLVLGLYVVGWIVSRAAVEWRLGRSPDAPPGWSGAWQRLVTENPSARLVEALLVAILVLTTVDLALQGIYPSIVQELATSSAHAEQTFGVAEYWHAFGAGSWILLGVLALVFAGKHREKADEGWFLGYVILGFCACLFFSGAQDHWLAGASTARWVLAAYWLIGSALILWRSPANRRSARGLLLALTVVPVLGLTLVSVARSLLGMFPSGPTPESWFGEMGALLSFTVPLILVSVGLCGHGVRERSPGYAFAGGVVLNLTVTLGYLVARIFSGEEPLLGSVECIHLLQWNAIVSAAFTLLWLAFRHRLARPEAIGAAALPRLLQAQVAIAPVILGLLILYAGSWLFVRPDRIVAETLATGHLLGWIALALACGGGAWVALSKIPGRAARTVTLAAAGIGATLAFSLARGDTGDWLTYHALIAATLVAAWTPFVTGWLLSRRAGPTADAWSETRSFTSWATVGIFAVTLLALRAVEEDPAQPWWSVGALSVAGALAATMALWVRRDGYLYFGGALFNAAATIWWIDGRLGYLFELGGEWFDILHLNVLAAVLPAGAAFLLTRSRRKGETLPAPRTYHQVIARLAILLGLAAVTAGLASDALGRPLAGGAGLGWAAWAATVALTTLCLWDTRAVFAPAGLFILGACAIGRLVDHLDSTLHGIACYATLGLSVYVIAMALLIRNRERWLPRPERFPGQSIGSLTPMTTALGLFVIAGAFWVVLEANGAALATTAPQAQLLRLLTGSAAFLPAAAVALLAGEDPRIRRLALWLASAAAVAWAWAWVEPGGPQAGLLNRAVLFLTATGAAAALHGLAVKKWRSLDARWVEALRSTLPWMVAVTSGALVFTLGVEIHQQVRGGVVAMANPAIAIVAMTLVGLAVTAVAFATVPGRDPLGLSERGRMAYVYGAEVLLGLFFLHLRLTKPEWFTGFFTQNWPLIVMGIALGGIGLSEVLKRQKHLVLAEPLERTGAFLPLLPVLGYWLTAWVPGSQVGYTTQLLLVGLIYTVLAVTRKSFGFGLLAALAANGGLWFFLSDKEGLTFVEHPQLWLIPLALSVLAAAYLNRDRLGNARMTAIRYGCLMVIYISSTADVFIAGVSRAPWMPLVLAALSVTGVLTGIALRIRSFLVAGSVFLLLSLVTMVWHASANLGWTWLWWVAGISLGVALLVLFGLFEKRRSRMLELVDGLKQWER